jgi:hypothetical protein
MASLNDRYDEHESALSNERQVYEATFEHREAAGALWMYHASLMSTESGSLDESAPLDARHAAYSRRVKTPGWEELTPKFMPTPQHICHAMTHWGRTGSTDCD